MFLVFSGMLCNHVFSLQKNHYREATMDVRRIMGESPEDFCDYWTSRFPKLLMHSWYAMHCVKNEHIFSRYYEKQYDFIQVTCYQVKLLHNFD